ncbi:MAG: hypothetical protein JXR41_10440 [Bacteroidales bacterium]|nr:hypothetical protein [Bacteroidales bacterium]MBN2763499.1 hypothetical protein [Bacteroidales bacterium]
MKTIIKLILPCFAVLLGIYTCEKEGTLTGSPSGKLNSSTGCNIFKSTAEAEHMADTLCCMEYSYNAENDKLQLKHINAGFNCCPEEIKGEVSFVNDTVIIKESERDGLCDCLCLYDLNYTLTGIRKKTYTICFIEPYAGDQEKLNVSIDLTKNSGGLTCVVRKKYPWGQFIEGL